MSYEASDHDIIKEKEDRIVELEEQRKKELENRNGWPHAQKGSIVMVNTRSLRRVSDILYTDRFAFI